MLKPFNTRIWSCKCGISEARLQFVPIGGVPCFPVVEKPISQSLSLSLLCIFFAGVITRTRMPVCSPAFISVFLYFSSESWAVVYPLCARSALRCGQRGPRAARARSEWVGRDACRGGATRRRAGGTREQKRPAGRRFPCGGGRRSQAGRSQRPPLAALPNERPARRRPARDYGVVRWLHIYQNCTHRCTPVDIFMHVA